MNSQAKNSLDRYSSIFKVLVSSGVVGLFALMFSHIFACPKIDRADIQREQIKLEANVIRADVTSSDNIPFPDNNNKILISEEHLIGPLSWPSRSEMIVPIATVANNQLENLHVVGLSSIIPPPIFVSNPLVAIYLFYIFKQPNIQTNPIIINSRRTA